MAKLQYYPKYLSIIIIVSHLIGILTGRIANWFRFSDWHWMYSYGKMIGFGIILLSVGASLLHPIILLSLNGTERKLIVKKKLLWVFLGFAPFVYFILKIAFF